MRWLGWVGESRADERFIFKHMLSLFYIPYSQYKKLGISSYPSTICPLVKYPNSYIDYTIGEKPADIAERP